MLEPLDEFPLDAELLGAEPLDVPDDAAPLSVVVVRAVPLSDVVPALLSVVGVDDPLGVLEPDELSVL